MILPAVAGSGLLWYLTKTPNRNDVGKLNAEFRAKGFGFNFNCKTFMIINARKAYQWAYQLGEYYKAEFGSIDEHFYKAIDPNKKCIDLFNKSLKSVLIKISKKDLYFFLELVRYYYQGLLKTGIPIELLSLRYNELVRMMITELTVRPGLVNRLTPA